MLYICLDFSVFIEAENYKVSKLLIHLNFNKISSQKPAGSFPAFHVFRRRVGQPREVSILKFTPS